MKIAVLFLLFLVCIGLNCAVMYVVNSGSETLSRIDTETGEVNNAFAVLGSIPNRIACTPQFLYLTNSGDNTIQKIDAQSGITLNNIFLAVSVNPSGIIIHEGFLYVSGSLSNQVYKIDLETDEVIDQINVGTNPDGMAVCNGKLFVGNTSYMTDYSNCSVSVIDLETFEVEATIPTNANPQFLLAKNGYIHVSCTGNWFNILGNVQIIDPAVNQIVNTIDFQGYCGDLAYAGEIIWVSNFMGGGLYAYDADSWQIVYPSSNPFFLSGYYLESDEDYLAILGGEWGQNFSVSLLDHSENLITTYTVGLYGSDIKFLPQQSPVNDNEVTPITKVSAYPNPFHNDIRFRIKNSRSNIELIQIYDVKGRLINKINSETWNGNSQTGNSLPSGIYYTRITTSDKLQFHKTILKLK